MPILQELSQLSVDGSRGGLSRVTAHLHILHHQVRRSLSYDNHDIGAMIELTEEQCIMIATRPLLLSCMIKLLSNKQAVVQPHVLPTGSVQSLLKICVDSAQQTLNLLDALQKQSLIGKPHLYGLEVGDANAFLRHIPILRPRSDILFCHNLINGSHYNIRSSWNSKYQPPHCIQRA